MAIGSTTEPQQFQLVFLVTLNVPLRTVFVEAVTNITKTVNIGDPIDKTESLSRLSLIEKTLVEELNMQLQTICCINVRYTS